MAGFAGSSVVLIFSFSQHFCTLCKSVVKKNVIFRPAGGDIPFRVSDRVSSVKKKKYHAVADESSHYWAQTPGLQSHCVICGM
jgi:hypothetical protein